MRIDWFHGFAAITALIALFLQLTTFVPRLRTATKALAIALCFISIGLALYGAMKFRAAASQITCAIIVIVSLLVLIDILLRFMGIILC